MTQATTLTKAESMLEDERVHGQLEKAACDGLDVKRLIANARSELAKNPALLKCTPSSIIQAVSIAARSGLQLGVHGEGYLIAFGTECTFVAGYRGLIRILYDGGAVLSVEAHPVYEGDQWAHHVDASGPVFRHTPMPWAPSGRKMLGVYAYAKLSSGASLLEVMTFDEVEAIRKRSPAVRAGKRTPWDTDYVEMARKCPIKRLGKRCPMSDASRVRLAEAIASDLVIEGYEAPEPRRTLSDAIKTAAQSVTGAGTASDPEPAQLPEGGPALSFLLSLVDVDLEQRAALLVIEDADLSRHLDTLADMPESQRSAYVTKSIIGGANV